MLNNIISDWMGKRIAINPPPPYYYNRCHRLLLLVVQQSWLHRHRHCDCCRPITAAVGLSSPPPPPRRPNVATRNPLPPPGNWPVNNIIAAVPTPHGTTNQPPVSRFVLAIFRSSTSLRDIQNHTLSCSQQLSEPTRRRLIKNINNFLLTDTTL